MGETKRSFMKRSDWLLLGLAALICAGALAFYWWKGQNQEAYNYAILSIDGVEVETFALADYTDLVTVDLSQKYGVPASLELENHQIRFVNVTCPDHICEGYGWISREMESAICLPNRTAVVIYTPEEMKNRQ